jgi:hypothetical protein
MGHWHTLGALAADHRADLARDAAGPTRLRAAGRSADGRAGRRWVSFRAWLARTAGSRQRPPAAADVTTRSHDGPSGILAGTVDVASDVR